MTFNGSTWVATAKGLLGRNHLYPLPLLDSMLEKSPLFPLQLLHIGNPEYPAVEWSLEKGGNSSAWIASEKLLLDLPKAFDWGKMYPAIYMNSMIYMLKKGWQNNVTKIPLGENEGQKMTGGGVRLESKEGSVRAESAESFSPLSGFCHLATDF